jgi:ribonuclease BN (tRNA processing enzyme)
VRLTVLGKSPSWQDAGGACSGYLLQHAEVNLLVDCGNGVFGKLRERIDYVDLDAAVVSHLHADHWLDLVPYSYALTYAPKQQPVPVHTWPGTDTPARPRLIAPPGSTGTFRRVAGAWGNEDLIESAFALEEYGPEGSVEVGPFTVSFHPVPHFIDTFAINVVADGHRLTYGADSRPGPELIEIARGADLLLVEATLPRPERTGVRGHMTPEEAGRHAREAGVKRVVLTHISDELGVDWAIEEAERGFGGPVEVAAQFATYKI